MAADVNVDHLRLRARRRDDVAPVVTDLEDALRTASLPGRSSGELIFIRRLDLGRIRRGISRQALARQVEARLATCRTETYRSDVPFNRGAEVIAFPDLVIAAMALLTRSMPDPLRDQALASQFGPAAAAGTTPDTLAVLSHVLERGGPAAAGRLLMLVAEREEVARRLLAGLSEERAHALRCRFATRLPQPERMAEGGEPVAPALPDRLLGRPGAVTREALARALTVRTPGLSAPARRQIAEVVSLCGLASHRSLLVIELLTLARAGPSSAVAVLEAMTRAVRTAVVPEGTPRRTSATEPTPDPGVKADRLDPAPEDRKSRAESVTKEEEPAPARADEPTVAPPPDPAPTSQFAGLVLFLRLFRLLDLDRAEEALDLPLQAALMARFAARLGIWEDDPLAGIFAAPPVDLSAAEITPHDGWMPSAAVLDHLLPKRRRRVRRLDRAGDFALLTDPRSRMVLGCLGRAARGAPAERHLATLDGLVAGTSLAMQRLARRLAGQSWRKLALRPAQVLCTNTHLDVVFSADLVDVAIRAAGLDINPGWVPWMGRVVTLHYDYSQPSLHAETRHLTRPSRHE